MLTYCQNIVKVEWNQTILPNVTGSAKTGHNRIFSNSCLLNIYNLPSQVYPLAKFQFHLPITLGVTALQSSNNRKIDLYSKYRAFSTRDLHYVTSYITYASAILVNQALVKRIIVRSVLCVYSILLAVERSHGCCGRELHLWQRFRRLGG